MYHIEIPGITNIAHVRTMREVVDALRDGACVNKMTVSLLCEIVDEIERQGSYVGYLPDTHQGRYEFVIRKEE